MKTISALAALLLSLSCAAPATPAVADPADERFAWFQRLPGTWVATEDSSFPGSAVTYRLTAGGSVLLETQAPGSAQEMLTAIHQSGSDLVLTHYCTLGNQPRMRAVARDLQPAGETSVDFRCEAGPDVREDGLHMHRAVFTFVGEDHLQTLWTLVDGGELVEENRMDLVRMTQGAETP